VPKAPAADQLRLLTVQELDTHAAQARHRLESLESRVELAKLLEREGELTGRRIEADTAISDLKREVTKAEDDVQSVRARAKRDNDRLLIGGQTPRDLQGLQSELEVLVKRQSNLEEIELDAMQRLEDAESVADGVVAEAAVIAAALADVRARVESESAAIQAELADIARERINTAFNLDESLLALYEKLRAQHGDSGAAALTRGTCQGCHMSLNPADLAGIEATPDDEIVRCEECGRILVRGTTA
jgi:predicted  nucleic acid-binding Zn-ribbon protein